MEIEFKVERKCLSNVYSVQYYASQYVKQEQEQEQEQVQIQSNDRWLDSISSIYIREFVRCYSLMDSSQNGNKECKCTVPIEHRFQHVLPIYISWIENWKPDVYTKQQLICSLQFSNWLDDDKYIDYIVKQMFNCWSTVMAATVYSGDCHSDIKQLIFIRAPYDLLPDDWISNKVFMRAWFKHNINTTVTIDRDKIYLINQRITIRSTKYSNTRLLANGRTSSCVNDFDDIRHIVYFYNNGSGDDHYPLYTSGYWRTQPIRDCVDFHSFDVILDTNHSNNVKSIASNNITNGVDVVHDTNYYNIEEYEECEEDEKGEDTEDSDTDISCRLLPFGNLLCGRDMKHGCVKIGEHTVYDNDEDNNASESVCYDNEGNLYGKHKRFNVQFRNNNITAERSYNNNNLVVRPITMYYTSGNICGLSSHDDYLDGTFPIYNDDTDNTLQCETTTHNGGLVDTIKQYNKGKITNEYKYHDKHQHIEYVKTYYNSGFIHQHIIININTNSSHDSDSDSSDDDYSSHDSDSSDDERDDATIPVDELLSSFNVNVTSYYDNVHCRKESVGNIINGNKVGLWLYYHDDEHNSVRDTIVMGQLDKDVTYPTRKQLLQACQDGDVDVVSQYLSNPIAKRVDKIFGMYKKRKYRLLWLACCYGHVDIVQQLVIKGKAKVNRLTYSKTYVEIALKYKHYDVVKFLITNTSIDINSGTIYHLIKCNNLLRGNVEQVDNLIKFILVHRHDDLDMLSLPYYGDDINDYSLLVQYRDNILETIELWSKTLSL